MKLCALLLAAMLCTLCVGQASALEYTMNAPDDYLFGMLQLLFDEESSDSSCGRREIYSDMA